MVTTDGFSALVWLGSSPPSPHHCLQQLLQTTTRVAAIGATAAPLAPAALSPSSSTSITGAATAASAVAGAPRHVPELHQLRVKAHRLTVTMHFCSAMMPRIT